MHSTLLVRNLHQSRAAWDGRDLVLDTGNVSRRWRLTEAGLATVSLRRGEGPELITAATPTCDWALPGGLSLDGATLLAIDVVEADDEGFASKHLCANLCFAYPAAGVELRFTAWAIPGAPGLRTVLALRAVAGMCVSDDQTAMAIERLAVRPDRARAVGYFNDTQNRNGAATPIIRDEPLVVPATCDWASICAVEQAGAGCVVVKESHHCANQPGHDGGGFTLEADGLTSTGWGLLACEITSEFRIAWAHWTLVYAATGPESLPTTLRAFIALRYPRDPVSDAYVMANTWGSTASGRDARDAAREDNVLREIDLAAELGVDVLQVDDGWQVDLAATSWQPEASHGWYPHPAVYPQGWGRIRAHAASRGVHLGLWLAGMPVTGDELLANHRTGGFSHFKLDFMDLRDHTALAAFRDKVRAFVAATGHRVRINFDVTERVARVGYLWLRELGSLYLANRKTHMPQSTIYRPWLVLRDAWQLSRWQRLQDVQITVQNPLRTDRTVSDAWHHPTAYCLSIALMGSPILFQQLQFLDATQRIAIRDLLAVWRRHRLALQAGDVTPIGAEPSNASHTGFHCRCPDGGGYVLVLRELENTESQLDLALPGVTDCEFIDCESDERIALRAGRLHLCIPESPGYRLLRYHV